MLTSYTGLLSSSSQGCQSYTSIKIRAHNELIQYFHLKEIIVMAKLNYLLQNEFIGRFLRNKCASRLIGASGSQRIQISFYMMTIHSNKKQGPMAEKVSAFCVYSKGLEIVTYLTKIMKYTFRTVHSISTTLCFFQIMLLVKKYTSNLNHIAFLYTFT